MLFFTLNREDFSFVIHLDRQPRTSRRREAQTGSRARSGSRSERTLDAVEHSRTLMEWWPFLIFHRGGLRIKVINNTRLRKLYHDLPTRCNVRYEMVGDRGTTDMYHFAIPRARVTLKYGGTLNEDSFRARYASSMDQRIAKIAYRLS